MERFTAAYRLAHFLHDDRYVAWKIALAAVARVEGAAASQDKRFYYRPKARRYKLSVDSRQLLRSLVFQESGVFERARADAGEATADALLIWLLKHLVHLTAQRSALYAVVAMCRVLHRYTTRETLEIYDFISQDPECRCQDDTLRAAKKAILDSVVEHFAPWVELERGARGEKSLRALEPTARQRQLVETSLERLLPSVKDCVLPGSLERHQEIIALRRDPNRDPDREQEIELRRIHAVLHPSCFVRLTAVLGLPSPSDRMRVPVFELPKKPVLNISPAFPARASVPSPLWQATWSTSSWPGEPNLVTS